MSKFTLHDLKPEPASEPEGVNAATGMVNGSFGIGTYRARGRTFPGLVQAGGGVYDLSACYADTHALFEDWDRALDLLADISAKDAGTDLGFADVECLPPVPRPNMLCTGSNYRQHVAEMMTYNKFNQDKRLPGESDEAFFVRNLAEVDRRAREGMPFFGPAFTARSRAPTPRSRCRWLVSTMIGSLNWPPSWRGRDAM